MDISRNDSCADDIYYQLGARMVHFVHKFLWENVNFYHQNYLKNSDNVDVFVVNKMEMDQD